MSAGSIATTPRKDPSVRDLEDLLDTTWRISLKSDGRVFTGRFMVVDRQSNVILDETTEEKDGKSRFVGLVMIPGNDIAAAEVDRDTTIQ